METRGGSEISAGPWEVFALASLAPLGPFSQVHLAPRIPPASLNMALRTYLSLQGDELLLALIDGGGDTVEGCCALTTRRVYWTALDALEQGRRARAGSPTDTRGGSTRWAGFKGAGKPKWRYHVLRYGDLPAAIKQADQGQGMCWLDLGTGRPLCLPGADPGLAQALARYLETMGMAARNGMRPGSGAIDPELGGRVARVLPAVARITDQTRAHYRDLLEFRRALFSATPHLFVTPVLTLACVALFVAMIARGAAVFWPTSADLIDWGANSGVRVTLRHEYWRLLASVFVHGGLIHLAVNMWCLNNVGPLVERLYGNLAFAILYLASGIGGAIASVAVAPAGISVGASGAIFGILGALLAFLVVHHHSIPGSLLRPLRASAVGFVVFNTIFGMVVPNIDQAAHLGGLATGFAGGVLLRRPWPVFKGPWIAFRRVGMTAVLTTSLAAFALAALHRGQTAIPPSARYDDVVEQLGPAVADFKSIYKSLPRQGELRQDRAELRARDFRVRSLDELRDRARKNLTRLHQVKTPAPELRCAVADLIQAQASVVAYLQTARDYLDDGTLDRLEGPNGLAALHKDIDRALVELNRLLEGYSAKHQIVRGRAHR
jgi:rhomboid protease GluP